jgi:hypothetical protein
MFFHAFFVVVRDALLVEIGVSGVFEASFFRQKEKGKKEENTEQLSREREGAKGLLFSYSLLPSDEKIAPAPIRFR